MDLRQVTPVVLTYNEERNISRCLLALRWAPKILVVDSFSNDQTLNIVKSDPCVTVVQRQFKSFADQLNFATMNVTTPWILALDADYFLSKDFSDELKLINAECYSGFYLNFDYAIFGKKLRGSLYPPKIRFYRVDKGRFVDDGHAEKMELEGVVGRLRSKVVHDDRKSLLRFIDSQAKYCQQELAKSSSRSVKTKNLASRVRFFYLVSPLIIFFYCLFVKGCVLDGRAGFYYAFQRLVAEAMGSLFKLESYFNKKERVNDY